MNKPRINIEVDEDLKHKAQKKALAKKTTLTKVIIDYLTKWVKKS